MTNELIKKEDNVLHFGNRHTYNLAPRNFEEAMQFSRLVADTELVPSNFKGKPENILIAIQMGAEIGLHPMQALQNISVINGRASLWGDAMLAVCQSHHSYESIIEEQTDESASCTVKRIGEPAHTVVFTKADAMKAGLLNKKGPWQEYPKRMMQMRARSFALRDKFADALKGLHSAEEVQDYKIIDTKLKYIPPKPPELASEDCLYQIKSLSRDLNKPDGYIETILAKVNTDKLEDLTQEFADKWLKALMDQSWEISDKEIVKEPAIMEENELNKE